MEKLSINYKLLEENIVIKQSGWDDFTFENQRETISTANSTFSLLEYLENHFEFEVLYSSSGWTHKTYCPFHKNGHERTPSFFVNSIENRFFCQGCGISGGLVEFISKKQNKSPILVAEHILNLSTSKPSVITEIENKKKADNRNKINSYMLKISDLFRTFTKDHLYDEDALQYIFKIEESFDNVILTNEKGVEANIDKLYEQFQEYLQSFDSAKDGK